jgi:hypothetical protein
VTEAASNLGLGNSRVYKGVLISNIGGWSICRSDRGGKEGGVGDAECKKACIEISASTSAPGVEEEASEMKQLAAGTGLGGLFNIIESTQS